MVEPEAFSQIGPIYDLVMAPVPYVSWVNYLFVLAGRHGLPRPRRILDLACGTGNVGLELARRGYQVMGVDRSEGMLEQGRRKAAQEGLPMEFLQQDMRELRLPCTFDWVVCLYDSLNYLLSEEDLLRTFRGVAAHLEAGGAFFFDMNTEAALEKELFTQSELRPSAPVQYRWKSRYNPQTRITRVEMTFWVQGEDGERREIREVHYERAYPLPQVERLLREAGLRPLGVYEAYSLRRPGPDTDRAFFLALRPKEGNP